MNNENGSARQLLTLLFAALLSPAIQVLPAQTAAAAGEAGWLSALFALPGVLLLCLALIGLLRGAPEGTGLAGAIRLTLGRGAGSALLWLYLLWGIVLMGAGARRYALRFLSTSYRNAPLTLFIVILLLGALWVGRGRLAALLRAGEILYLALAGALGLVLVLGLFQIKGEHLLPVWLQDLPGAAASGLSVLSVTGYAVFGGFLAGAVKREAGNRRKCLWWSAAFCGVLGLLQLVCLGCFGPELIARMDEPFFMMVKGVGVQGAFERVESVIIALWVLSDLALLSLLVFGCRAILSELIPVSGRGAAVPIVLAALAVALFCFPDGYILSEFMEGVITPGSLVFGFVIPVVLWGAAWLRKRGN